MPKNIACLGWGSLIWRLNGLPVNGWRHDGPCVRVEFARQSSNGSLTLVLHADADPVPSLWAEMKVDSLDDAVKALAEREGSQGKPLRHPGRDIGRWPDDRTPDPKADPANIIGLPTWAAERHVDFVIWTALRPKFNGIEGEFPETKEDAVAYLRGLSEGKRAKARDYVRYAPQQIGTAYREHIARCLGWELAIADCRRDARAVDADRRTAQVQSR